MPKINVYLSDDLAKEVREANLPVSTICQLALEDTLAELTAVRSVAREMPRAGLLRRFTPKARAVLVTARSVAEAHHAAQVDTEHLLVGLLDDPTNLGVEVLESLDIDLVELRRVATEAVSPMGSRSGARLTFSAPAKAVLAGATKEALSLRHNYIGCEHLLVALVAAKEGAASATLQDAGLDLRSTRRAVVAALTGVMHARAELSAQAPTPTTSIEVALDAIARRLDAIESRLDAAAAS